MLRVKLTVEGPFLTQSSAVGAFGVDSPLARNAAGTPYIPGTLVKGKLTESWKELRTAVGVTFAPDTAGWLGGKSGNPGTPGSVAPRRGRLQFSDFLHDQAVEDRRRYRIKIDSARGAAKEGAYQVIESLSAIGQPIPFHGEIRYLASDNAEARRIRQYVEVGLRWITTLGAERSIGFGKLTDVQVDDSATETVSLGTPPSEQASGQSNLEFRLSLKSPFCIARKRPNYTLFESEEVIPGGVIKGALASSWRALLGLGPEDITAGMDQSRGKLCEHFHLVRFSHAFPAVTGGRRPVHRPLSIVKTGLSGGREFLDVIHHQEAVLFQGNAPAFAIDWKRGDRGKAPLSSAWPEVKRELRVRTAINTEKRRAEDEHLFAYEMVVPEGREWVGCIDISRVPNRDKAQVEVELLSLLRQRIRGIGKTKAHAEVAVSNSETEMEYSSLNPVDECWVITLQTPAILCDPAELRAADGEFRSSKDKLWNAYSSVWAQLSGGSVKMENYFAQQDLSGG
ncbi:MAG: RAMP superfamily CRISPR-associated protein, partial [Terriglobia bacterium]